MITMFFSYLKLSCNHKFRCPEFNQIPDTCRLVADKNDPCCVVPDCNVAPTMPPGYTGSTTPRPVFFANPVKNPGFSGQTNVGPNNPLNTLINGTGGKNIDWSPLILFQVKNVFNELPVFGSTGETYVLFSFIACN